MRNIKQSNQKVIGVILSYVTLAVNIIVSFLYTPIMLRLVGQSEYGLYSLAQSFISYLGIIQVALSSSYIVYYMRYTKNESSKKLAELNGIFIIAYLGIGTFVVISGRIILQNIDVFVGTSLNAEEYLLMKRLLTIMIFNLLVTVIGNVFESFITVNEKFIFQRALTLCGKILSPFVTLPLLLLGYRSIALVLISLFIAIIQFLIRVIVCIKKLKMTFAFPYVEKNIIFSIFGLSAIILIQSFSEQLYQQIDRFILIRYYSSMSVAVYAIGCHFNEIYITLSKAIATVFAPQLHYMISQEEHDKVNSLVAKVGKIQFAILGVVYIFILCFGKEFFIMWAGMEYLEAYYVAIVILLPMLWGKSQELCVEAGRGKKGYNFYVGIVLLFGVANVLISIPLCKKFGIVGCAIGTSIALLLQETLFMHYYVKKIVHLEWGKIVYKRLQLMPALVILTIAGFMIKSLVKIENWLVLFFCGILYLIVTIVVMFVLGCSRDERKKICIGINSKLSDKSVNQRKR